MKENNCWTKFTPLSRGLVLILIVALPYLVGLISMILYYIFTAKHHHNTQSTTSNFTTNESTTESTTPITTPTTTSPGGRRRAHGIQEPRTHGIHQPRYETKNSIIISHNLNDDGRKFLLLEENRKNLQVPSSTSVYQLGVTQKRKGSELWQQRYEELGIGPKRELPWDDIGSSAVHTTATGGPARIENIGEDKQKIVISQSSTLTPTVETTEKKTTKHPRKKLKKIHSDKQKMTKEDIKGTTDTPTPSTGKTSTEDLILLDFRRKIGEKTTSIQKLDKPTTKLTNPAL